MQPDFTDSTLLFSPSQNPPGSGSFLDADWTNDIIAFIVLLFTVMTYVLQQRQNRLANAEQKEKDRLANLKVEELRQQTIRLEWYRDIVRGQLEFVYSTFEELYRQRETIRTSDLTEEEKSHLSEAYKKAVAKLRNGFLERILFVHKPTYDTLKAELNKLTDDLVVAIFDDELKLSKDTVYEREIGSRIRRCQQQFFKTLYAYRGEQ